MSEKQEQLEDRLVRSETSLAHLAHDLEQINDVVIEHTKLLQVLEGKLHHLIKRIEVIEDEKDAGRPKPPPMP